MLPRLDDLLIVVADGEHARFVRTEQDYALKTQRSFDAATAHHRASELGSDKPGESFHSQSSAHHGVAPRHDPHALAKEGFSRFVAAEVNEAAARGEFERLVIAAPAHGLQAIRDALSTDAEAKIVGTVAHDLVKVPDHELQPHLSAWVRPVHRAVG